GLLLPERRRVPREETRRREEAPVPWRRRVLDFLEEAGERGLVAQRQRDEDGGRGVAGCGAEVAGHREARRQGPRPRPRCTGGRRNDAVLSGGKCPSTPYFRADTSNSWAMCSAYSPWPRWRRKNVGSLRRPARTSRMRPSTRSRGSG